MKVKDFKQLTTPAQQPRIVATPPAPQPRIVATLRFEQDERHKLNRAMEAADELGMFVRVTEIEVEEEVASWDGRRSVVLQLDVSPTAFPKPEEG